MFTNKGALSFFDPNCHTWNPPSLHIVSQGHLRFACSRATIWLGAKIKSDLNFIGGEYAQ